MKKRLSNINWVLVGVLVLIPVFSEIIDTWITGGKPWDDIGDLIETIIGITILGSIGVYISLMRVKEKQVEVALRRSHEQLRLLSSRIQQLREYERKAFADIIHDELGHYLTAVKMDIASIEVQLNPDQKDIRAKLEDISGLLAEVIKKVIMISTALRPAHLDDLGLDAAIKWKMEDFSLLTGIRHELAIDDDMPELEVDVAIAVFRVFEEILANISQHSEADLVKVKLSESRNRLLLRVADNGTGIAEDKLHNPKSTGLRAMMERISEVEGEFEIEGKAGKGTTVSVMVPLG